MDYDTTPSKHATAEVSCNADQIRTPKSARHTAEAELIRALLAIAAPRVIGGLLAFLFFGLIVSQTSTYISRQRNQDSAILRAFVGISFLLVAAHTILEGVIAYQLVSLG